jgi:hypothetical protein
MKKTFALICACLLFAFGCEKGQGTFDPDAIRFCKVNFQGRRFRGEFEYPTELLEELAAKGAVKITTAMNILDLSDPAVLNYDVIYLTGQKEFHFEADETEALRTFLLTGGFLIADACSAHQEFDSAFRKEIKKVLPEHDLAFLPTEHPAYTAEHRIEKVKLKKSFYSDEIIDVTPQLEGIVIEGRSAVFYSSVDLGRSWKRRRSLQNYAGRGVLEEDAYKIAENLFAYVSAHKKARP